MLKHQSHTNCVFVKECRALYVFQVPNECALMLIMMALLMAEEEAEGMGEEEEGEA